MLDPKVIEFVLNVNNSILRVFNSNNPEFTVEMQEGDDAQFHAEIIRNVATLNGLKALLSVDSDEIIVIIKEHSAAKKID